MFRVVFLLISFSPMCTVMSLLVFTFALIDEGLYRCEGIDQQDGCTYYFTTETEENSKSFKLFVQKEKGNTLASFILLYLLVQTKAH